MIGNDSDGYNYEHSVADYIFISAREATKVGDVSLIASVSLEVPAEESVGSSSGFPRMLVFAYTEKSFLFREEAFCGFVSLVPLLGNIS